MDRYYVLETQRTPSGDINFLKTEQYSLAKALSYYYARKSAYYVDTTYIGAAVSIVDENLMVIEQDTISTQYKG